MSSKHNRHTSVSLADLELDEEVMEVVEVDGEEPLEEDDDEPLTEDEDELLEGENELGKITMDGSPPVAALVATGAVDSLAKMVDSKE